MKHYRILFLIIAIGISSFETKGQKPDNTKPMYGEVAKSDEYKKIDKDFKQLCLNQFGTIDSAVQVQIGNAWRYFYHNDLKTAMKRFNQAWFLNPDCPDSYFGFAALMEMQDNKTEAERFYKIGEEKDKSKERAQECYQRIADCKEQLRDFKGTIKAYTKLTELNPNNAFAFKKIGYFQMQIGNSKSALTAYGKAVALDPMDAMTYNNRAYLYQTKGSLKAAIADYTKAIELDSTYISAYVNRGITQMEGKNYDAAKKDFEICVKFDSNSGELRRLLGESKLKLKDRLGACKEFELAKQLGDTQTENLIKQNCK